MTLWICIGVYVVGVAVAPCILSFADGKPWAERGQGLGYSVGVFITLVLWPVGAVLWLVRVWACFMSDVGVKMFEGVEKGLDALKEALDD